MWTHIPVNAITLRQADSSHRARVRCTQFCDVPGWALSYIQNLCTQGVMSDFSSSAVATVLKTCQVHIDGGSVGSGIIFNTDQIGRTNRLPY